MVIRPPGAGPIGKSRLFKPGRVLIADGQMDGGLGRAGTTAPVYRNLSTRGNFHLQTNNSANPKLTFKSRTVWPISSRGGGVTTIVPCFANWKQTAGATPFEANGANDLTITKCSLEYNGVTVPVTFSGSRSITISAGTAKQFADAITVSVSNFGVSKIPAGATVYFRTLMTVTSGQSYPAFTAINEDVGYRYNKDTGGTNVNLSDDIDSTGAMAVPTSADTGHTGYIPVGLFGYFFNGDVKSLFSHGDSIAQGSNDAATVTTGYGWIRRGCTTAGIAHFGMSIGGMRVTDWTTQDRTKSKSYLTHFTHALQQVGFNDVGGGGSLASVTSIWSDFRTAGIQKLYQTLIGCKTSSTNATKWTDLSANQNVTNVGFQSGNECDTQNTTYLGLVGSTLDGTVDASTTERDQTTDHTKWALRAFNSTLAAAYTGGATTISLNAAPSVGEWLAVSSAGTFDAQIRRVNSVSGSGPYTVTLGSSATVNAGFTSSHSSSDPIYGVPTNDGTHPNDLVHAAIATANSSFFSGLVSDGVA